MPTLQALSYGETDADHRCGGSCGSTQGLKQPYKGCRGWVKGPGGFHPPGAQDLRAKTRIHVPDSALLMGVMDEASALKYGEVFLAVNPDPATERPRIVTGHVVVAKNPCFHPGDVRRLKVGRTQHACHVRMPPKLGGPEAV